MAESAPLLPDDTADPSALFGSSYAPKIDTDKLEKSTLQIDRSKLKTEQGLLSGLNKQDDAYKSLADRAYKAEAFDQNDPALKGWNADAERAKYSTDPLQAFGSFASVAGIIASAFVHAPIATALDASASAMNAIKAGDDKMFDAAHQAWKDNTELFLKRHEMQHQAFTDALELRDKNWTVGNQKFKEAALMYGDQQMLAMHEAGMFPEIEALMQHRQDSQLKLAQAYPKMEEDFVKMGQMFALGYDPKEPGSDKSIAAVKKWNEQYGPYAARGARTAEETVAIEARAQEIVDADPSIPPGKARMMAEAEWSESKGAAASTRTDKTIASREKLAQLSADTKVELGKLSAETRKELAEYAEAGKDKRQDLSEKAKRELAGMNNKAREELQEYLESGRNERAKDKTGPGSKPSLSGTHATTIETRIPEIQEEHPDWSPGKVRLEAEKEEREANAPPITGNEKQKLEAHIQQYGNSLDKLDKVTDVLDKYVGAAGVAGKVTRSAERVRDIFGSKDTDRVQMMRDIEYLQFEAPRLLLDAATGRPLSSEAGRINDIIGGLSMGDTTANTLRALKEIKTLYTKMKADAQGRLGGSTPNEPASSAPASSEPASKPKWHDDL